MRAIPGPHAGERLVEQHDLRIACDRHGDLELALLAVAERAGERVARCPSRRVSSAA